jgi:hypothetical protein
MRVKHMLRTSHHSSVQIERWPYRKLKSMDKLIRSVQEQQEIDPNGACYVLAELARFKEDIYLDTEVRRCMQSMNTERAACKTRSQPVLLSGGAGRAHQKAPAGNVFWGLVWLRPWFQMSRFQLACTSTAHDDHMQANFKMEYKARQHKTPGRAAKQEAAGDKVMYDASCLPASRTSQCIP